jgi:hypothetical protein
MKMKKLKTTVKSMDVSVSAPGVDPCILLELGDGIADAQDAAEDAKATADEAQKESIHSSDTVKIDQNTRQLDFLTDVSFMH